VSLLNRLLLRRDGAAAVEFGILAPVIITMLLGVLQVGIAVQNYNALRGVSADVTRYAMIQYATGNKLSNSQMTDYTRSVAQSAPYLLNSLMNVSITDATTPQVSGVKEKTLTIEYQIPSIVASLGLSGPYITYSRPLFLVN
jgi:Flp pilus assembly protein TadG